MAEKNGIGYSASVTPTIKAAGASPGYDPFTKSISKGKGMSAGPISIPKTTGTPSRGGKVTMKSRPGRG